MSDHFATYHGGGDLLPLRTDPNLPLWGRRRPLWGRRRRLSERDGSARRGGPDHAPPPSGRDLDPGGLIRLGLIRPG
jgi:hypothetical protein